MTSLIIVIVLLLLIGVFLMVTYNSLVILRQRVQNSWSQIDIQLKRRHDLIPNLVEIVKGALRKHPKIGSCAHDMYKKFSEYTIKTLV